MAKKKTTKVIEIQEENLEKETNTLENFSVPLRKKELINKIVEETGIKKPYAKPVIESMLKILGEALHEEREIALHPMGKIKINRSKELENARIIIAKIRQTLVTEDEETSEV